MWSLGPFFVRFSHPPIVSSHDCPTDATSQGKWPEITLDNLLRSDERNIISFLVKVTPWSFFSLLSHLTQLNRSGLLIQKSIFEVFRPSTPPCVPLSSPPFVWSTAAGLAPGKTTQPSIYFQNNQIHTFSPHRYIHNTHYEVHTVALVSSSCNAVAGHGG